MMMTKYKRLDEQAWLNFGKSLLNEKGSDDQKEFLKICKAGKVGFLNYLDDHLFCMENSIIKGDIFDCSYRFSEAEFRYPPKNTQEFIWNKFKDVSIEVKHCSGFWGYTIINMIKNDSIKPDYLSSKLNGSTETGIYVIDEALNSESYNPKTIDDCVRRILRSMCNPAPRGPRILFNDFYLGKAYWRWHWANKMSKIIDLKFEKILEIFGEGYYAEFSAKMHSGRSYISSKNVLGGLLLYLHNKPEKKSIGQSLIRKIIDKISYLSAWKAIEVQEPSANQEEIQKIAENIIRKK